MKKGGLQDCNNCHGITLLSLISKVFNRIIQHRVIEAVGNLLRQEQRDFRKGKSCTDDIFVQLQILGQSNEWISALFAVFVVFEKAFDSIHRKFLGKILHHNGTETGSHHPVLNMVFWTVE